MSRPDFKITREDSIKLFCRATDKDDPNWENLVDDFYDKESDTMPTIYEMLAPLGITKEEINKATLGL